MKAIDRQQTGTAFLDPGAADWQDTDAPGFRIKPIFTDSKTGESTALMQIAPGAYSPPHAHDQLEEIYVLDGDFHDDEYTYTKGQYCQRAIGAIHSAGSENGCTVLLVYRG